MHSLLIFIITLCILSPAYAVSLEKLVADAWQNNPEILAAQKTWQAAQAKAVQVSTWKDPKFELMYEQVPTLQGSLDRASMRMYGLSQMIPFPGKLTLKRWLASDGAKAAEQKYQAKVREITAKVKSAYYALFLVERSLEINQENKELLKKFAKIAEAKYVVGSATQHDVLKAQIQLSLLENELITLEKKKQTAQARLNALLNREMSASIEVSSAVKLPKFGLSRVELEEIALAERPELKAKEYHWLMSQKAHTLALSQYLPDFNLKALRREMRTMGLNGWNVILMADMPIWFWREAAGVSAASAKRDAAAAAYRNMANMVRFEVQDAYTKVDANQRLSQLFKTSIVPQAEQALQAATRAYEADKVDFLTLINSQKTLMDVKLKHFKAQAGYGTSLANLEKIIGRDL